MDENIGTLLAQVSRLLRRNFDERARGIGVTRPQWQVLGLLKMHAGSNQGTLAELLEVEPITLGRMIDRLQEAGLVERRADPADRRAWRIFLTDKGGQPAQSPPPVRSGNTRCRARWRGASGIVSSSSPRLPGSAPISHANPHLRSARLIEAIGVVLLRRRLDPRSHPG